MARWSENTTVKFVEEYIRHQCLWNVSCRSYKNKQMRQAAYLHLINHMAIDGFGEKEVTQKIKNIRSTYSQEKRKIKDSKMSGGGAKEVYHPTVKWYYILDNALKSIFDPWARKSQLIDQNEIMSIHSALACEESHTSQEQGSLVLASKDTSTVASKDNRAIASKDNRTAASEDSSTVANKDNSIVASASHMARLGQNRKVQELQNMITNFKGVTNSLNQSDEENEFTVFGRSIGLQLQSIPLYLALQAQNHIQSYLTTLRIQYLQENQSSPEHIVQRTSPMFPYSSSPGSTSDTYFEMKYNSEQNNQPAIGGNTEENDILSQAVHTVLLAVKNMNKRITNE